MTNEELIINLTRENQSLKLEVEDFKRWWSDERRKREELETKLANLNKIDPEAVKSMILGSQITEPHPHNQM
jgi:hypothetical protein